MAIRRLMLVLALAGCTIPLAACVVVPERPGPRAVWVPGHYDGWHWVRGHWD